MKKQVMLSWLRNNLIILIIFFVSCKKDNYKMDMDVGKFEIIQYRSYPNGTKDTLKWNGYGPKGKPQNIYVFYKNSGDDSNSMWTIDFVNKKLSNWDNNSEALFYKIISETHTSERMEVTYDYLFDGYVSDSASGKIMFNRVPL